MAQPDNKTVARGFVQTIFNERKIDEAKNFVTPDITYHAMEEVKGLENFKQWIGEDLKAFPDMNITIVDSFGEQDKLAMRWNLKGTFVKELRGTQPSHEEQNWKDVSHEKFETQGVEIFHFQDGKIKEAWTIFGSMDSFK
ncbi:MAG: ester cyclase [Nitrososphaeraceae archaeon]|jgi:predicted SnoaL-like aldol condensation-catalyzing enzyme|nr:ester cyclase [Nitrososphaeraceae archaeon]MDW0147389.1 ester cyclase [Nitrososphaeraceae archaeon]MDW0152315.1 ester cyclase [Nitrososphaeraceae archaeon]MDW0199086.1 ester cyclase [Nitrososphaeraceae archaeon]MDW0245376.1 ester cyclase [Nitrososphaeraceae archaeon]